MLTRLSIVVVLLGGCADNGEHLERQSGEMREAQASQRYRDVVESVQVAVRSVQQAQGGRSGLGRRTPPPVRAACEDLVDTAKAALGLPAPHPRGYDLQVRRAQSSGASCLSAVASISASEPATEVMPDLESQLERTLSALEAYEPNPQSVR